MQSDDSEINPYLQQEILSASPIRLRLMLIQRAEELCGFVRQLWQDGELNQAAGWLLRIREILGELLGGVTDKENPVSQQVSDFYVFLLQLLTRIEQSRDPETLQTLQELLHLENETWQQVVHNSLAQQATEQNSAQPIFAPTSNQHTDYAGGFNLEV